jgi:hypothetical protein
MNAAIVIPVLAGLAMPYLAIRMIRSRGFTVQVITAKWNPNARMYVRSFGLECWVSFTRKVISPVLLIVSFGLWGVVAYLLAGGGK